MTISRAAAAAGLALYSIAPISSADEPRALTPTEIGQLEQAARATVDEALAELLAALSNRSGSDEQRLKAVEGIVRARLDFPKFARFSLSRNKSRFSKAQFARYLCEFDPYLSHYIGSRLVRYQQEKVRIFQATALSNQDVNVDTRILGGSYDQAVVTFRMRRSEGKWLAIDVSFEGVKVLKVLRAEFESVLQQGGPDHLIAMLQEKTPGPSPCTSRS